MEKVYKYVDSVYKNVGGNKEEIKVLKEEMRDHLLQMIEDLKAKGKSEDESISIAIKSFGEETQIENELLEVFKFVDKRARKALIIAAAFLLITVISFASYIIGTNLSIEKYRKRNDAIFSTMSSYNQENLDIINKNISTLINNSRGKITYVTMFRAPNGENMWYKDLKDLVYIYPSHASAKVMDKGSYTNNQIISEKGIKYNVNIGESNDSLIPMYIQNIGRVSFVWLACFVVSLIIWILIKMGVHINSEYQLNK